MELDDAYANVPYIPGGAQYPARWTVAAEAFRARLSAERRAELGLPYGDGARQAFDLFHPTGAARGLCVFVHGGYWLRFDRTLWSHLAAGPLARGWAVAMPSYDLCPEVRIADITRQIARAICVMAARTDGPLALVGHSAGGHLVARMAVPGVLPGDVAARLSHVMPISPVSDLRPLLQTSMNEQFRLDRAAAEAESPALMRPFAGSCHGLGRRRGAARVPRSGAMAGRSLERRPRDCQGPTPFRCDRGSDRSEQPHGGATPRVTRNRDAPHHKA